ncbi:U-box domain-containing protein 27-like isoform X1 [Oryza brachyantha]|uniref:U-box domain-containing protein 27-like isoform X1 n=1 Tax=Oryza brachyantha TaxID=4533 RepID=UPI001ADCACB7|nr:U-box domain-containing protein 27-like isoform X1 [Oryza brachyantha]
MVRKESTTSMRLPPQHQGLEVKIPSFFRCPISLNVMRSPVSLCTGVTYDRASIQRWLDSGNNTCPATMLPLPSTDLVPNLTLRSLIAHWSASAASSSPAAGSVGSGAGPSPACLVRQVASSDADPSTALRALAAYLSDDDVDEFEKNTLVGAGGAAETVASVLRRKGEQQISVEGAEAAVRVLAATVALDGIEDANKKRVAAGLAADASASAASLARVLRGGSGLEARIDAARLVEFLLANAAGEAKEAIAESSELVGELIRLVGPVDEKGSLDMKAVDTGLSCLATISRSRRAARAEMVRLGAVPAAVHALHATAEPGPSARALRILESAVGCAEGRAALCEHAEEAVPAVVGKMMKAGRDGAEAAVAVLWAVCHKYKDRRAADAAAASEGGLTRLLLLLQSGCSPAARQMALELLKIYKVNAKSCLAGYDSKTTHIMPF